MDVTANAPTTIVIFGASGDLTHRKLIPALFNLYRKKQLPPNTHIVGYARRPYSTDDFRKLLLDEIKPSMNGGFSQEIWDEISQCISYVRGDLDTQADFDNLDAALKKLEGRDANRLYYLATAPNYYAPVVEHISAANMAHQNGVWRRLVVEKPFGTDQASANELNRIIHKTFEESQVYRIDHYIGKETAQNILFLRFANTIFEPIWNRNYIEQVQITVAESLAVDSRAGYYDKAGVVRDMFQNHLMQLLALVAMEPPASFSADPLRNEKVKVLQSIRPIPLTDTVRGQVEGYQQITNVAPGSQTATFAAIKLQVDNWRWQGVPFYIRSGKSLSRKVSQISIEFKRPPHLMFQLDSAEQMRPNVLSMCIQPDEGIQLSFEAKDPDSAQKLKSANMSFSYKNDFGAATLPDAYERLLANAISGDAALFTRSDEIDNSWKLIDPILQGWETTPAASPLAIYKAGTWGPRESDDLLARAGHIWREDCGK